VNRSRTIGIAALLVPVLLNGQQPRAATPTSPANAITASFKFMASRYGAWLATAFDSIPAAKYSYRPTASQQSLGYIAQHLEAANYGLCERLGAAKHATNAQDALPDSVKATWPKDTLVARLKASLAFCDIAMAQVSDAQLAVGVPSGPAGSGFAPLPARSLLLFVTDLAEHYSQVANYMRLIDMIPPSALPPKPRNAIDLPVNVLARYVGKYDLPPSAVLDVPGLLLEVTVKDGGLYFKPGARGAVRLWPETEVDFFVKDVDAQVTFTRDASGANTGLVVHQFGENRTASKLP
jgi:hypothetical protein